MAAVKLAKKTDLAALDARVDSVESSQAALALSQATVEELVASASSIAVATGVFVPVFVAPFPCRVAQVSLVPFSAVAASNTNYWTVKVQAAGLDVATKDTKTTGGEALVAGQDWNFDAAVFANNNIVKGNVVGLLFTSTGSPAAIDGVLCQVRYEPT